MPKQKIKFPKCSQKRRECFACNKEGKCKILTDTSFRRNGKRYPCPFYKSLLEKEMCENDIEEKLKYELR